MKIIPFLIFILASLTSHSQEKLVKLKGSNYNVYLKGFENRKPNTPALIFESGMGTDLGNWDKIIDELSKSAPVFAYDRASIGASDTDANNERWKRFINSSTKGGALIYLTNCGHFVHRDDPKMVITNIKMMIENLKN